MDKLSYVTFIVYLDADELRSAAEMLSLMADHYSEDNAERGGPIYATPPVNTPAGAPGVTTATPPRATTPPPAAPPATSGVGVALDAMGLPWDPRIHAKTKNTLANGQWRRKRGVDLVLVAQVEAELHATMAAPAAPPVAPPVTPPVAPPTPPAAASPVAPPAAAPPVAPGIGVPPVPPAPPVTSGPPTNMRELVTRITAEGIPQETVIAACSQVGVATLPLLGAKPGLIPTVAELLGLM